MRHILEIKGSVKTEEATENCQETEENETIDNTATEEEVVNSEDNHKEMKVKIKDIVHRSLRDEFINARRSTLT